MLKISVVETGHDLPADFEAPPLGEVDLQIFRAWRERSQLLIGVSVNLDDSIVMTLFGRELDSESLGTYRVEFDGSDAFMLFEILEETDSLVETSVSEFVPRDPRFVP